MEKIATTIQDVFPQLKKVRRAGNGWSACCPAHDDRTPSLSLNEASDGTLLLYCHAGCSFEDIIGSLDVQGTTRRNLGSPNLKRTLPYTPIPVMDGLREILSYLQDCLPGSVGERYLKYRGISLEVAKNYGLGYAQEGEWPHFHNGRPVRQWKWGRVVFPHTSPDGTLVNLYGRAVGDDNSVPKSERHDHLPGNKAYFNAQTMARHEGPLFVCEGTFDALTVLETTRERAVAIYGVHGWRREWCRGEDMVIVAFDNDPIGRSRAFELMRKIKPEEAVFPGIIAAETYGGEKDLNAALMKGCLQLGRYQQSSAA